MQPLAILIMAAGASTRFGAIKQLAALGSNTLLQHSINVAYQVLPGSVYVVLGAHASKIRPHIASATIVVNPLWSAGLGTSIACGIHHIEKTHRAALIMLADQPLIRPDHLCAMIKAHSTNRIVCANYQGTRGVPAVFPECCFDELKALSGDQGAKKLLQETPFPIIDLDLPEASVDIDIATDLSGLCHSR